VAVIQTYVPTPEEVERRKRIRVVMAAAAYELCDQTIMTDAEFDKLAREIDVTVGTGNEVLDQWFKTEFNSSTGSWVYSFPELDGIMARLRRIYGIEPRQHVE
jgi:hypothetical protein